MESKPQRDGTRGSPTPTEPPPAESLLRTPAQRLTTGVIKYFWMSVGGGVKPDSEIDWMNRFILGDPRGGEVAARIDATIGKLPGLAWFDRLARSSEESLTRLGRIEPALSSMIAAD